jgi:Heterokaryon incompatibility protein (HET)
VPPYAILSHTWGEGEITFQDISTLHAEYDSKSLKARRRSEFSKLSFFTASARKDALQYCWMDTCCIDKSSSAELSEAINSMFSWYQNASMCYVYLSDISRKETPGSQDEEFEKEFMKCQWFTRGWTLQELLAPQSLKFYSYEGTYLGDKRSLENAIRLATGIPVSALRGDELSKYSIEERLSWVRHRRTTRVEDGAYCLLGLFGVNMPLLYGEGSKAMRRLREEIVKEQAYREAESVKKTDSLRSHKPTLLYPMHSNYDDQFVVETGSLYLGQLGNFRFRILRLEPGVMGRDSIVGKIQEFSLKDQACPTYLALSYVWGQEPEIHQIVINGVVKLVRPNLFQALQRIRHRDGPIHLWVDSLCINQSDEAERNAQVMQMANIYHKADGVLIWLGEADSSSNIAMEFIPKTIKKDFEWNGKWWDQFGFKALAQLLERPWFRRGWVVQEAAFSKNSSIHCGDRQVHLDVLEMAVDSIQVRLNAMLRSFDFDIKASPTDILAKFLDSPAVELLYTIKCAFRKSLSGRVDPKLSLETLVDLVRFTETTDPRDSIYALLNLADDVVLTDKLTRFSTINPDYGKSVMEVFADFILHCSNSGSLDILCRPWAPTGSSDLGIRNGWNSNNSEALNFPSWIIPRNRLPFGDPSWRSKHRLHGDTLVGRSEQRLYNAHYGTKPDARIERYRNDGKFDGSLHVKGFILGEVLRCSPRMVNGFITKDCLSLLGNMNQTTQSGPISLPESIWRTLCADRDENGRRATSQYKLSMLHLLEIACNSKDFDSSTDLVESMTTIDTEELLDSDDIPSHIKKFLKVVQGVVWNRRTFQSKPSIGEEPLVGLIPQHAKVGDQVCILNGCSVPLVLRKQCVSDSEFHWQLIGEAYVNEMMDGEFLRYTPREVLEFAEFEFEIR